LFNTCIYLENIQFLLLFFSIEVFDADKLGKDKSLGVVEINPRDLDGEEAKWFPLKGVKSGEILLNGDILAPGQSLYGLGADGQLRPVGGILLILSLIDNIVIILLRQLKQRVQPFWVE